MTLKNKILIIIGFCVVISIGSFFIIKTMFDRFEDELFKKCEIETITGARVMSDFIEFMIKVGLLTERDVFDTNYIQIPGSNPIKYHTKYDRIFDENIQKIEDEFLYDTDLVFAILIDKNGYVPTHNTKFSQPQTGNYQKDLVFSRSKRNFSDNKAIMDALKIIDQKAIKIFYRRDTGEAMWIIGSPVFVKDKHWGAFIIGVSLDRITEIKNQMILIIAAVMFIILSMTILALLAIMPRQLFHTDIDLQRY